MTNCRRFAVLTALTFLVGVVLVSSHFDPDSAWYFLGLTVVLLAAMAGVCWFFAGKRATLDDAFEAGFQAGFYRGERVRPKVIRLPTGPRPAPSSRR